MNKQALYKLIGLGLFQWLLLMITIFVISLIYGVNEQAEMSAPPLLGYIIAAVILAVLAYACGRWLKPARRSQAIQAGLFWSILTTAFWLITVFGNGTQETIFSNWGVYLLFIAQLVGTLFVRAKKTNDVISKPVA
ncbi:MAG: hypothetical protein WC734_01590 [Patescibacteria group bacterium]|jgi:hypothetical protein